MRAIEGAGLVLEPQVLGHAAQMFPILSDPAIYEHENDPPESLELLRQRFARLETRRSGDGTQQWLNWVIRLPDGNLAGYVQATVHADGTADIAYILSSEYWGRGIGQAAVRMMIGELAVSHGVLRLRALLKSANVRSLRLLQRLGFATADAAEHAALDVPADEVLMVRAADRGQAPAAPV